MRRSELEHILRASKDLTGESEFVVIGSQSILGPVPDAPKVLRKSLEADLYPRFKPELSDTIEGTLGRYSQFNVTFGYYADGVSPTTATLPPDWEQRLVKLSNQNTNGAIGWCLEPHDLAYSKLAAAREKDIEFVRALLKHKIIRPSRLERLIHYASDPALREKLARAFEISRRPVATI